MKFKLFGRARGQPSDGLDEGWQFCTLPTELDPPGTIYRIDAAKRKIKVAELEVPIEVGREAGVQTSLQIQTRAGLLARFLGLDPVSVKASAGKMINIEFALHEPQMEQTTDVAIKSILAKFSRDFEFDSASRYFVIRGARSASSMSYRLSREQMGEIGGLASLTPATNVGLSVGARADGTYQLQQDFPTRLRVMILPEEIASDSLGQDVTEREITLIPVRELLEWEEVADYESRRLAGISKYQIIEGFPFVNFLRESGVSLFDIGESVSSAQSINSLSKTIRPFMRSRTKFLDMFLSRGDEGFREEVNDVRKQLDLIPLG